MNSPSRALGRPSITDVSLGFGLVCALAASAAAQGHRHGPELAAQLLHATELVPIHTRAQDSLTQPYGIWAAGRDYKVSFHDGMVFYPYVGPDRPHRPVRWRTASVTVGGRELLVPGSVPKTRQTDWRFEYDHGAVVERYDVLAEGVEQSFVLHAPAGPGDLLIRGAIDTALALPAVLERDGPLELRADGGVAIGYGTAVAIDAAGRRTPVLTGCDGREIRLCVPGAWLAGAAYPVVVDPLLQNRTLGTGAPVVDVDVLHERDSFSSAGGSIWVVASREVAAGDVDLRVRRFADDFSGSATLVYANIDTGEASHGRIALADSISASDYTVTAYQYRAPGGSWRVEWHRHNVDDFTVQTNFSYLAGVGMTHWRPDVGGSDEGKALIVYQVDGSTSGNTTTSIAKAALIDVGTGSNGGLVSTSLLRPDPDRDQERPTINRYTTYYDTSWIVAFQELDNSRPNDDWDIVMLEVGDDGNPQGSALTTDDAGDDAVHKLAPIVDGDYGRYCVVYSTARFEQSSPRPSGRAGETIRSQRVDWSHSQNIGSRPHPSTELASARARVLVPSGMGHDRYSESHWCATWLHERDGSYLAAKLGFQGASVETLVALAVDGVVPVGGGVDFNTRDEEFVLAFGGNDGSVGGNRVLGARMVYDTLPDPLLYGFACGSGVMGQPYYLDHRIGNEGSRISLHGAPEDGTAFLLMSFQPARIDLRIVGMDGCDLLVDPNPGAYVVTVPATLSTGYAGFVFDVPESLSPFRLYFQWIYPATRANALNHLASQGLRMDFRR